MSSINRNQDRKNEALVNEEITASIVLVVDNEGKMLGEMSVVEGIQSGVICYGSQRKLNTLIHDDYIKCFLVSLMKLFVLLFEMF